MATATAMGTATAAVGLMIPIDQFAPSPTNPRKIWNKERLADLTASVQRKGILQPLLVRPNPKARGFEIVAGECRHRAAKAAGLAEIPAVVRELSDVEVLEIQLDENAQRTDLHPLEEAEGYRQLMARGKYDVARIAERTGRSVKYVYDRMKLLELTKPAQKIFLDGKITAGHAVLLARLSAEQQAAAMKEGALFQVEHLLWDPSHEKRDAEDSLKARSVREFQGWIDEHVRFDVGAPDPMLFPETALMVTAAREQDEKIIPITHESYIQPEAREGRTYGPRSWKRADGQQKSKPCPRAVTGIVTVGAGRGDSFKVCVNRENCEIHWGKEIRERKKRATAAAKGGAPQKAQGRYAREEAKQQEERDREEAKLERFQKARPRILEAIAAQVKKAPTKASGLLADLVVKGVVHYQTQVLGMAQRLVPRASSAEDVVRHAAFIVLCREANAYEAYREFSRRAKAFGVDVQKIVDEVAPKEMPKKAETKASEKKAKG
jgi:ParB/RepB/Spo0J family partition protein